MSQIRTSLLITGDSSDGTRAVRTTAKAIDELTGAERRLKRNTDAARQSASVFNQEMDRSAQELNGLRNSLDPVAAAIRRLEASEETLTRAFRLGNIDIAERDRLLGLLRQENARALASTGQLASGQAGFGKVLNQNRFAAQQLGFQIQDIAVQLQAGTRASIVASQQGSQILGIFGATGALLGAALAVAIPVGDALIRAAFASGEVAESTDTFTDSLSKSNDQLGRAEAALKLASNSGAKDLKKIYGELTSEVQALALALADIETTAAIKQVATTLDTIFKDAFAATLNDTVGGTGQAILESTKEDIELLKQEIGFLEQEIANAVLPNPGQQTILTQLREELAALTGDLSQAGELAKDLDVDPQAFARIQELSRIIPEALASGSLDGVAEKISELRTLLTSLGVEVSAGFGAELTRAEALIRRTQKSIENVDKEGKRLSVTLGGIDMSFVLGQASILAQRLGISVENARSLNAALNQASGIANPQPAGLSFGLPSQGDGTVGNEALGFGRINPNFRRSVDTLPEADKKASSSAASALKKQVQERGRLIDEIDKKIASLGGSYERDVKRLEAWREESLATLDPAKAGFENFAADVNTIFEAELAEAYRKDLDNRSDWAAGIERGLLDLEDSQRSWADTSESLFDAINDGGQSAFRDLVINGKAEINDLRDAFLGALADMAFQASIQPAISGLFNLVSGSIGSAFGFPGGSGPATPTLTSHTGSIVGSNSFKSYPKGLKSNEQLAVVELGQRIFTPSQVENGAAIVNALAQAALRPAQAQPAGVVIEVNNYSSAQVETSQREDGTTQINILDEIESNIAGRIASGRSGMNSAIEQTYSIRRNFGGSR